MGREDLGKIPKAGIKRWGYNSVIYQVALDPMFLISEKQRALERWGVGTKQFQSSLPARSHGKGPAATRFPIPKENSLRGSPDRMGGGPLKRRVFSCYSPRGLGCVLEMVLQHFWEEKQASFAAWQGWKRLTG